MSYFALQPFGPGQPITLCQEDLPTGCDQLGGGGSCDTRIFAVKSKVASREGSTSGSGSISGSGRISGSGSKSVCDGTSVPAQGLLQLHFFFNSDLVLKGVMIMQLIWPG